jgi:secondary thiamine-phosphate synthase enzyme
MHELLLETREREAMVDITDNIRALVRQSGMEDGIVVVQSAHTTLGLTINENADPAVQRDFLTHLKRLVPRDAGFIHQEGNSDSHIKVSLTAPSVTVFLPAATSCLAPGRESSPWNSTGRANAVYMCK